MFDVCVLDRVGAKTRIIGRRGRNGIKELGDLGVCFTGVNIGCQVQVDPPVRIGQRNSMPAPAPALVDIEGVDTEPAVDEIIAIRRPCKEVVPGAANQSVGRLIDTPIKHIVCVTAVNVVIQRAANDDIKIKRAAHVQPVDILDNSRSEIGFRIGQRNCDAFPCPAKRLIA